MESGIARSGITKEQRKYLKAMQVRSTEGVEVLELRELPDPIGTQEWDSHLPLLHPDDHAEMRRAWSHCLRTGCPGEVSFRARNAEGGYRWFLSRVEPLLASDGTVLYWIGVTLDIDDTKRAEEALRKSEKELRDVIDTIPAIVWSTLPDGSNTYVNKRYVEYTGSSPEQVAGSGWEALIHPDDLERHAAKWMEAVATGKPHESEVRSRRSDGQYRWQLDRGLPLRDEDGNIVKWYGVTTDIEERKRSEDKIREQEAELRQILDFTPQHLFVFGPDGTPQHANRAALEYFGVNIDQLLADSRINFVHPDDRARFLGEREKGLLQGLPHEFEARLLRYDGSFRWFLFRRNPFKDAKGHVTRWYGAAADIEDRKQAEDRLRGENVPLREEIDKVSMFEEIVGTSPALQTVLSHISIVRQVILRSS